MKTGGTHLWTVEEAIDAGARFVQLYQQLPASKDACSGTDLPYGGTIKRLFGSLQAWHATLPLPQPPPPLKPRYCLMCTKSFTPDYDGEYICKRGCRETEDWTEPPYVNGTLITERYVDEALCALVDLSYADWRERPDA
jgi:hypothetical protein